MNKELYAQTLSTDSFYKAFPYETIGVNSRTNATADFNSTIQDDIFFLKSLVLASNMVK